MTVSSAIEIQCKSAHDGVLAFEYLGVDVAGMTPEQIKATRSQLMRKHHPDHGGDTRTAQLINAAFDFLKFGVPDTNVMTSRHYDNGGYRSGSSAADPIRGETPEWAWAGARGMQPRSTVYRADYTDDNFVKKSMWELSGRSRVEYTIWGFDGRSFCEPVTVFGSPAIFHYMAYAMIDRMKRKGRAQCRSVFITEPGTTDLHLVYADGRFFEKNLKPFRYNSCNFNPNNDDAFVRRLSQALDELYRAH